ncbi:O-antigen ligase family protein [Candidatus Peregrinibacteria bacterium]|nr:O-antigen ligase family protein [Candidatus Peregrinibacteria bacterium]
MEFLTANTVVPKEPNQKSFQGTIRTFSYFLLFAFLFLLPFHAFLVTWMRGMGLDSIWVTLWREIILGILTVLAVANVTWGRLFVTMKRSVITLSHTPVTLSLSKGESESWQVRLKKIRLLDWLIAAYFLLGAVYFFYKRESMEQWLLGARYDFEFLYFYLLVRIFAFGEKEIRGFLKSALFAAVLVVIFGWILNFLPQNFLTQFGYAPYADEWSQKTAVFACHYVEFDQNFCRMQSTFGGPGRYGLYLLFVIIASGVMARSERATKQSQPVSAFWPLFFLLSLGALYLTLSRSAWIGLFGVIGIGVFFFIKNLSQWKRIFWKSALIALPVALIFTFLSPISFETIFLRPASSSAHFEALAKGIQTVMENPFGIGLGKAGPASIPFEKFLTENAYLQIAVEMGWLGGVLFLAILIVILREIACGDRPTASSMSFSSERLPQTTTSDRKSPQILHHPLATITLLTLIALMISGLFVHSFEEMSLNLTLFGFIGLLSCKYQHASF